MYNLGNATWRVTGLRCFVGGLVALPVFMLMETDWRLNDVCLLIVIELVLCLR